MPNNACRKIGRKHILRTIRSYTCEIRKYIRPRRYRNLASCAAEGLIGRWRTLQEEPLFLLAEEQSEEHGYDKGKACEYVPGAAPVANEI